jgi:hypothetical protein
MGGGIFGRSSLGAATGIEAPVCDTNSPDFNADMCYTGPFPGDGQGHPLPKKIVEGDGGAQGPCPNGSYVNPSTGKCVTGGNTTPVTTSCPAGQTNVAGICVPTGTSGGQKCPAGTMGVPPVCVPTGGGNGGGGNTTPAIVGGDIGQGTPKTDYTLPIVLGAGLLVLGVGAYFLLREPRRAPVAMATNRRRRRY